MWRAAHAIAWAPHWPTAARGALLQHPVHPAAARGAGVRLRSAAAVGAAPRLRAAAARGAPPPLRPDAQRRRADRPPPHEASPRHRADARARRGAPATTKLRMPAAKLSDEEIRRLWREHASYMCRRTATAQRVAAFGVSPAALAPVFAHLGVPAKGDAGRLCAALLRHWLALVQTEDARDLPQPLWGALADDYRVHGAAALARATMGAFLAWLQAQLDTAARDSAAARSGCTQLALLREATDLRAPAYAYTMARTLTRHIHLHVGPTNSGKTHSALVALARARKGLYAGPLRLLAHEVWERLNEGTIAPDTQARACNLRTGEEQRIVDPLAGLVSCTVEMADPGHALDVAVVDEIQMIGDLHRGSAWTQAVLGLPAKELHLCGEASVVPLMERIAALCGDVLHVHEYERLTPLGIAPHSLHGDLSQIQRGDCIVAFSRSGIFQLKQQIEAQTGLQCAVAYGALPPETKSEQAKLFNSGKLDVMVASDAIGMGLNLKVKRIIFDRLAKWNGERLVALSVSQIKQIAGRAGRYGTTDGGRDARGNLLGGTVLTRQESDMRALRDALAVPIAPIAHAVIQPTPEHMESLSLLLPRTARHRPSYASRAMGALYEDINLLAQVQPESFVLSSFESQQALSPILELRSHNRLTHAEKEKWVNAPVNIRDERAVAWVGNAIEHYAMGALVSYEDCADMLGTLDAEDALVAEMHAAHAARDADTRTTPRRPLAVYATDDGAVLNINTLMLLESHHRSLSLYLWLSYRFPLAFCFRADVDVRKTRVEAAIEFCLESIRVQRARRLERLGRGATGAPESVPAQGEAPQRESAL
ncbi:RNA helicase [Malassezia sp. CBS 17886]|nr:RNA helicase [Malassezia sp. CBS 17886]